MVRVGVYNPHGPALNYYTRGHMLRFVLRVGVALAVAELVRENLVLKRECTANAIRATISRGRADRADERATMADFWRKRAETAERDLAKALARVGALDVVNAALRGQLRSEQDAADEIVGQ